MGTEVTTRQIWSYIIGHVKPFPSSIFIMVWVACAWAIDLSLRPYLLKVILNRITEVVPDDVLLALAIPMALYLAMYLLMTTSFRLYGYFVEIKMIPAMRSNITHDAVEKLLEQSHTYYQNNFSGSLVNKVNDLKNGVPSLIQIVMDRFFSHFLALAIGIITLWQVNILFAICMFIWTFAFLILALSLSKYQTRLADDWSEYGSVITGKVVDVISNILSVRLFSSKVQEKNILNESLDNSVHAEKKLQWSYFWMWMCFGYAFFILQVLNFYFLCKGLQEGWITVGDFALVLVLNLAIVEFMWRLAKEFSEFATLYGRITQALRAILNQPDLEDEQYAAQIIVPHGKVTFDSVKFHYKGTEPLFNKKSVIIEAGQKVGLVGYSGSGKTTFVNLILRLYDVSDGRILIDGQDIAHVTQDSLREAISMIPQDPSLFHRTLMDNIRYGKSNAKDAQVINAAKKAHAHEFIRKLPEGYESLVGERGVKLSGGQRQRIAIARAILKNAPILILDEATSQLDSVTESDIQDSLWELMQDKTTIVIAHRLSTLLHMDRILVFDQGKIVEDGTHKALLAKNGLYKSLWDAQVGGFLPDKKGR